MRETGSTCRLYFDAPQLVEAGDFVRSAAGACYRVDAAHRSSRTPGRWMLCVTRLDRDAVAIGAPGVHLLWWYSRRRRAPR